VALSFVVIPFEMNSDVSFACPICCDLVMFFEDSFKMLCMLFADIFYTEIIDYQCELYGTCLVFPEAGYDFALVVTVFVESFLQ